MKYIVTAPQAPGAQSTVVGRADNIRAAREIASEYRGRRDLSAQDVRIERESGKLVEYAGPLR